MARPGIIIVLSGAKGAYTKALSAVLAEILGWKRARFSDFIRDRATLLNEDPEDTSVLQRLGPQMDESKAADDVQARLPRSPQWGFRIGGIFLRSASISAESSLGWEGHDSLRLRSRDDSCPGEQARYVRPHGPESIVDPGIPRKTDHEPEGETTQLRVMCRLATCTTRRLEDSRTWFCNSRNTSACRSPSSTRFCPASQPLILRTDPTNSPSWSCTNT
jgi:hypothetical protein